MEELELTYDTMAEVPDGYAGLYEEKDGKAVLTKIKGLGGMRSATESVTRLEAALSKERGEHRETKASLGKWKDLGKEVDEMHTILDRLPGLEAAAKGKLEGEEFDKAVEARVAGELRTKLGPLERELKSAKTTLEEVTGERDALQGNIRTRTIRDAVVESAAKAKVIPAALDDVALLASTQLQVDDDGVVRTTDRFPGGAGMAVGDWLTELQPQRPHWWPESEGGGSKGAGAPRAGGGRNPWSRDAWNVTEQGRYEKEHGLDAAKKMAKAAGVDVYATEPAPAK
jgi:hypothetical protein